MTRQQLNQAQEMFHQRDAWLRFRYRLSTSTLHLSDDGSLTWGLTTPEKAIDVKTPLVSLVDGRLEVLENQLRALGVSL